MREKIIVLILISIFGVGIVIHTLFDIHMYDEPLRGIQPVTVTTTSNNYVGTASLPSIGTPIGGNFTPWI